MNNKLPVPSSSTEAPPAKPRSRQEDIAEVLEELSDVQVVEWIAGLMTELDVARGGTGTPHPDCPRCQGTGECSNAQFRCICRWHRQGCALVAGTADCNCRHGCDGECSTVAFWRERYETMRTACELAEARAAAPVVPPAIPKIICLCGSTRFIETFAVKTWELELEGHIVLGCTLLPSWYCPVRDHFAELQGVKPQRDEHHLRKIDLADEVLVLNIGGYIGESTRNEIAYATAHGKPISYVEPRAASVATEAPQQQDTKEQDDPATRGGKGVGCSPAGSTATSNEAKQ